MADAPAYIRNFKNFTNGDLTVDNLAWFEAEAYGGSDRARAIMLSSVAETALEDLVRSKLIAGVNADDRRVLFDFNGPLGSFSSQILMAANLGWIGPNTRNDLDLVRVLRNGFAHCRKAFGFETHEVAEVCKHLRLPDTPGSFIPHGYLTSVSDDELKDASDKQHPRTRYIMACFIASERLLGAAHPGEYNVPAPD